jgi:putative SOS response-associated peptidase YedK
LLELHSNDAAIFAAERMTMWPVSKAVGNVKNQGAELAERIAI